MTTLQWEEVKKLFHESLALPRDSRSDFLSRQCFDNVVRDEVERLLAENTAAKDFLMQPPDALNRSESEDPTTLSTAAQNAMIGPYRLLQEIGRGGMGDVWLAEQKYPVRRRVAIKLIRSGMNTREVVARFESERQALALMDHPAIAKVLDAGSTLEGQPYFVMEYVAGIPITDYCDKHKLTTKQRLELFIPVCEGVQHAHQKAIIHRDLKPSNILVSEMDGKSIPKIIDFGVAKAIAQQLTPETMHTQLGAMIGTIGYMSPEQADPSREDVDTRSDVYSLGVVLYELLVGALPFDFRRIAFDEALRRLRLEDAPKPSTKLRAQGAHSATTARNRDTDLPSLTRQVQGDPDSITLKALEKERRRRYDTPLELAADIARYLRHEPVTAHAPSVTYRAQKYVRRHRVGVAAAAAIGVVLIVATTVSIRQSIRANREAAVARAISDFLQNDLLAQASAANQSGPATKPNPHIEVRTALDRAAARIGETFDGQPEVQAAIRTTIGETYSTLGLYAEAHAQFQRAMDLYRQALGPESPNTLKAMSLLGDVADKQGDYSEAEALLTQALATQRRIAGPESRETLRTMNNLSIVYQEQGKDPQAEALLEQTSAIKRRLFGPEHPSTLRTVENLALVYEDEGKFAKAEALFAHNLAAGRRVLGPEHPDTLLSMSNLALVLEDQGKYSQAEALFEENLVIGRRVLGPEHPGTLLSMGNLAVDYANEAKYTQGEALLKESLEAERRKLGREHPTTLLSLVYLASMYQAEGQYNLAETYAAQALAGQRHALGSDHPDTMASAASLALALISQQKFAESEPVARESFDFFRKNNPDSWETFRTESLLGASLAGQKKYAEAEPLLLNGFQGMLARKQRIDVPDWSHLSRAHDWIVQLYHAWGKETQAAEWGKK